MPSRNPFYSIPDFPKTGNEELDLAFARWKQDFEASYTRNLFEMERLPALHSTFSDTSFQLTTVAWGTTVLSKTVNFQGNEQVVVVGSMTGNIQATVAGLAFVTFTLFVTLPDGSVQELSSRVGNFGITSTGGLFNSVVQTWRVEPRIQIGGNHTFALRAHRGGTTNNLVEDPGLIIEVL